MESDLFGCEERTFTGAPPQKMGLLEIAHRGTLFLDELGDMDIQVQPKLLKVLDEGRFRRVGGVRDREADIHLISSTHRDLVTLVADEKFRRDLFFRVSTLSLVIPPLRVRTGDIPVIARYFLDQLEKDLNRGHLEFGKGVLIALRSYDWPGNVRELRTVLERAALFCTDGVIRPEDLHFQIPSSMPNASQFVLCGNSEDKDVTRKELERQYISYVLQKENGRVGRAAKKLGIPRNTFYAKLKQYDISAHPDN